MSDETADDHLIAVIPKNGREQVHVSLSEYRGSTYANIRVWAKSGDDLVPTKAGITFNPNRLADIIDALTGAKREAERRGLIGG